MSVEQQIYDRLNKPIVLIGMMGSGKSHAGHVLAKALELPFIDSDQEIEKRAGCSVAEIFERDGEEKFRAAEKNTILALLNGEKVVIATGGGAITNPDIAQAIWDQAYSIWLSADLAALVKRLEDKKDRPLLAGGDIEQKLRDLLSARQPVYEQANMVIDTTDMQVEKTLQDMLQALDQFLSEKT